MVLFRASVGEFQWADQWFRENGREGYGIQTVEDLNAYHRLRFGNFSIIFHSWWVPRKAGGSRWFPVPQGASGDSAHLHEDGWPLKQSDPRVSHQPILTDQCQDPVAAGSPDLEKAERGHPYRGQAQTMNLLFGDGHVETRPRSRLQFPIATLRKLAQFLLKRVEGEGDTISPVNLPSNLSKREKTQR